MVPAGDAFLDETWLHVRIGRRGLQHLKKERLVHAVRAAAGDVLSLGVSAVAGPQVDLLVAGERPVDRRLVLRDAVVSTTASLILRATDVEFAQFVKHVAFPDLDVFDNPFASAFARVLATAAAEESSARTWRARRAICSANPPS